MECYAVSACSDPEIEAIEEHLLWCPACWDRLRQEDEFVALWRLAVSSPGYTLQ